MDDPDAPTHDFEEILQGILAGAYEPRPPAANPEEAARPAAPDPGSPAAPDPGSPALPPESRRAPECRPRLPGVSRQKAFIIENASVLDKTTKLSILSLVVMEVGPEAIFEPRAANEVDVNLDTVADANEDVLAHIYNIVQARLEILSQPARTGGPP